jgi:hypothetical protein
MPYAAVQLPLFPLWLLLAYYAIVVGGWLSCQHQEDVPNSSSVPR